MTQLYYQGEDGVWHKSPEPKWEPVEWSLEGDIINMIPLAFGDSIYVQTTTGWYQVDNPLMGKYAIVARIGAL